MAAPLTRLTLDAGAVSGGAAGGEDYDSEFESGSARRRRGQVGARAEEDLLLQPHAAKRPHVPPPPKTAYLDEVDRYERGVLRQATLGTTAYDRHQRYVNDYIKAYGRVETPVHVGPRRNDFDVIAERHRFVWEEGDEPGMADWEGVLAKRYFDKLYKEYCLADLSQYEQKRLALRWRTEDEVISGKGHFSCGSLHCRRREGLRSWEVPFSYLEQGEQRRVLVKLRLCPKCSSKLLACSQQPLTAVADTADDAAVGADSTRRGASAGADERRQKDRGGDDRGRADDQPKRDSRHLAEEEGDAAAAAAAIADDHSRAARRKSPRHHHKEGR